ncbi:MAG: hypothetical protein F7C32_01030 [Desulfurococcales archaeon]|nr:hypothetical protein [Desulfurococcales archaeon]
MSSTDGLVFVAFLFIGMGLGMLVNRVDAGTLLGMGAGFLSMALLRMKKDKKSC